MMRWESLYTENQISDNKTSQYELHFNFQMYLKL